MSSFCLAPLSPSPSLFPFLMRVLLVDNSKPECAIFTPKLEERLRHHAIVTRASTRDAVEENLVHTWDAIVLSGSSLNMSQTLSTSAIAKDLMVLLRCNDVPILGVCFGMQLMAVAYGGEVRRLDRGRQGEFHVQANGPIASGGRITPFFHHQDEVAVAPPGFVVDATDEATGMIVGMHSAALRRYGVQYHPECSSGESARVLERFLALATSLQIRVAPDVALPRQMVDAIALDVARKGAKKTAWDRRMDVDAVLSAWKIFREELRIPALLV